MLATLKASEISALQLRYSSECEAGISGHHLKSLSISDAGVLALTPTSLALPNPPEETRLEG